MGGWTYQTARSTYHVLQRLKNASLRRIDPPVLVLLYHRVTVLPADPELLAVSPENFQAQLTYLKGRFPIVRLEDDWSTRTEPAVCITFDDGYADNAREALPILEAVGVPATFFISSGHVGTGHGFWWDRMARLLLHETQYPEAFTLADQQHGRAWPTATLAQRQDLYTALATLAQQVDRDRLHGWLEQLGAWSGRSAEDSDQYRALTEPELRALAASPWSTIGAHTVSHRALSALSETEQRHEIFTCKETLEKMTGTKIRVFSYPFGNRRHYDRTSVDLCREAGFVKSAANFPGQVHRWTDPYQLPRQVVRNWDLDTFANRLKHWI